MLKSPIYWYKAVYHVLGLVSVYCVECIQSCVCISLPRIHKDDQFDHFTEDQKSLVRNAISKSVDYLRENNHGNTLGIEDYLN